MKIRLIGASHFWKACGSQRLKTYETIDDTLGVVGRLFSGRVSVRQLQSVVGISRAAGQAVHKGAQAVISLMVLISVNLGILNLLPIPILDGGNILLLAIEGGLRRDLSMAFKERFVQVGLVFLLVLFAIVMYNDVARLLATTPSSPGRRTFGDRSMPSRHNTGLLPASDSIPRKLLAVCSRHVGREGNSPDPAATRDFAGDG